MSQQPPDRPPEGWGPPPEGPPVPPQGWGPAPEQPTQPLSGPPTQAWGQQPPPDGPQKPRKPWYLRPWPVVGLIVLAGLVLGMLLPDPDPNPKPTTSPNTTMTDATLSPTTGATTKATEAPSEAAAGIGDPVRDGKFEFVVRKVDCGKTRIGDQYLNTNAQGKFCLVSMRVTNIGKESQTLDASSQYMYGSGGQRFDADGEASIYLEESKTFLE